MRLRVPQTTPPPTPDGLGRRTVSRKQDSWVLALSVAREGWHASCKEEVKSYHVRRYVWNIPETLVVGCDGSAIIYEGEGPQ